MGVAATPTKVCPRCGCRKPWDAFYARTRWDDGTVRSVHAYCKPCNAAKRSESYARRPGSRAESNRRYRERMRNERPARWADYQEKQRFYARMWKLARGGNVGARSRPEPKAPQLPAGPFRAWLLTLDADTVRNLPASDTVIRRVRNGRQALVSIDTVDRCCLHLDVNIDDLYPLEEA